MIEASSPSGTVSYVYDQAGHLLGEYDGSGNLIQETAWLGNSPVATLRPNGSSIAIYYVVTDQLDTLREVIRPSDNAIMWSWFTGPFGTEAPNANSQGAGVFTYDLRFPGQIGGAWGSTYQNNFRDYDSAVGRYVESDRIGLHGGSYATYEYAKSAPISAIDSLGLAWKLGGSEIDDILQNIPDSICDYWPAYCITRIKVCVEAKCKYNDKCGNTWYVIIDNWYPGPWPTPDEVTKEDPNCLCTKWKFRSED